ncbi:hypothetical protein [Streptomyces sp. NPDC001816]|uniref:hypothetical protein n=1 Tax=Streptomyces sp. NPDC001816 TaxID=3364612 RepID=UPI0036872868
MDRGTARRERHHQPCYAATHLGILPWLECRVPERGCTARLRCAIEQPWMFLSETLDCLVVVSEAEYYFEAYLSRRPT